MNLLQTGKTTNFYGINFAAVKKPLGFFLTDFFFGLVELNLVRNV